MFSGKSILVIDIETDSLNVDEAKMKWFGAYSYLHSEYYLMKYKGNEKDILALLKEHKVHVGFNIKEYDNPIISNNFKKEENIFEYKVLVDLLEMSAPSAGKSFGQHRKNKLAIMGVKLKNFTLKNIIEELKLDREVGTKGEIDYHIFQKDEWSLEEMEEIKKYLKQDIDMTKKLFEWYEEQFAPLKKFLPQKDQDNFLYLKSSLAVLAYNIICNKAGLKVEFGENTVKTKSYEGGHHIEPRWNLMVGNIIEVDFTSAYPHAIMMGNLHSNVSKDEEGWDGDGYYTLEGKYDNKNRGKIELALKDIFFERLRAKEEGDKPKDKSYKIVINSHYGTSGNPVFKSIYNRNTASDCTSIVRTWMKKLAKTLEIEGFTCLYGFTDSIFILIPPHLNKSHAMDCIHGFIKEALSHMPFPMDTFKMAIEEEIKMIWFVAKNCYLFVTHENEVKYKSTLLNTNTPKAVMNLFENYMKPIIIQTLSIPFKKKELEDQLKLILEKDIALAAQEYNVGPLSDYKVNTSLQYQISDNYGVGRHFLIPNKMGMGVGLGKNTKKKRGVRYCTIQEFKDKGLRVADIDLTHLLSHLKSFYERNEIKENGDGVQTNL